MPQHAKYTNMLVWVYSGPGDSIAHE